MSKKNEKYVVVTTKFAGCFAGWLEAQQSAGETLTVTLRDSRCAISWNTTGGFGELSAVGPNAGSKLGSVVPRRTLPGVTAIDECTAAARMVWIGMP